MGLIHSRASKERDRAEAQLAEEQAAWLVSNGVSGRKRLVGPWSRRTRTQCSGSPPSGTRSPLGGASGPGSTDTGSAEELGQQ
jgi:hypothetical protein